MKKTNFDMYLEEQLKDPVFTERFEKAGEAWDVALQLAALGEKKAFPKKTAHTNSPPLNFDSLSESALQP